MNKLEKLYEEIMDIIAWAEDKKHITEDASNILRQNITSAKEKIAEE